jgi:peptidoglycan/xylan/chitin deacetylase (PgdA/CDA1 family)
MVVQNTYNAGHFIGMTYRVKNDDSSVLSEDEIRNDIINDARTIQSLINVAPKYVRLHYTNPEDTRTENILKDLGMVLVGYNLDSQDYSKDTKIQDVYKTAFQKQKDTYDAKGSFISIQYDIPDTSSLESISYILNSINDEGYTMVRMDGCLNDPKPYRKGNFSCSMSCFVDVLASNSSYYFRRCKHRVCL